MDGAVVEFSAKAVVELNEKIRVLHVDDDSGILKVTKQCLETEAPVEVDAALSVEEALKKLEKEKFDVVVSDYQMPGKDGLDLLRTLRTSGNMIPFIMFTGKGREEVAIKALNLGANQYLNKVGETETVFVELAHSITELAKTRRAEEKQYESEEKFRNLFEKANDGLVFVNLSGRIVDVNQKAAEIAEKRKEEIVGRSFLDLGIVSSRDLPILVEKLREQATGKPGESFEFKIEKKNGEKRLIEISSTLIQKNDVPTGSLAIVRDITERKKAEEALLESEAKYRELVNRLPEMVFEIDTNANVVFANNRVFELTGYSEQDFHGFDANRLVAPEDSERSKENMKKMFSGDMRQCNEYVFVRKDGTRFPVSLSSVPIVRDGKVVGARGIVVDITERKRIEAALIKSEAELKAQFYGSPDLIMILDRMHRYVRINRAHFLSYDVGKLIGTDAIESLPSDQRELARSNVDRCFATGKIQEFEHTLHKREWIRARVVPLQSADTVDQVMIISTDITEEKKNQQELRRFSSAVKASPDGIITGDLNGNVADVNEAALRMYGGEDKRDLIGKNVQDLLVERDRARALQNAIEIAQTGMGRTIEYAALAKNGLEVPIEVTTELLLDEDGKPTGFVDIIRDITERKKAEQELLASLERYRSFVEITGELGWTTNASGEVVEDIPSFRNFTGQTYEEVKGWGWTNALHPDDAKRAELAWKEANRNKTEYNVEYRLRRHDGVYRYFMARGIPVFQEDGSVREWVGTCIDITERKKVEELVSESQQKFEALFLGNPEAAVFLDTDFQIVDINPRFKELFGYSLAEIRGKQLNEVVVPDDKLEEANMLDDRACQGYARHNTVRKRRDGSLLPVSISATKITYGGKLQGYIGVYTDITELTSARDEAEEAREHFETLFNLMADPVAIVDGKGKVLETTSKVYDVTGFTRREIVGKNLLRLSLFSVGTKAALIKSLAKRMLGSHVSPYEIEVIAKDGRKLPFEINATKIDYKGKPADLVVFHDVSERKKMEEKLRIVGSLTRHDVRNKLTRAAGNAYLLKKRFANNSEAMECISGIETAIRESGKIFDFASAYERLGAEELDYVDVNEAIDQALALFPDLKGVKVIADCGGLKLLADSLLRQLFYNLVDDTLKYGEKTTQIRIHYGLSEDGLRLIYQDDGVGISKEAKARLFNEGFTTGKGSGYGLYLIRRMMDVYGWTINETGTAGKGAQFTINVPKAKPDGRQNYKLN